MRAKSAILPSFVLLAFFSCSTIKYKDMASSNPRKLISLRDSLDKELSPGLIDAFVVAYSKVGIEAYNSGNYEKSINMFLNSQELSPGDTFMGMGLVLKKKSLFGALMITWVWDKIK